MDQFARAPTTKYHRLGGLNNTVIPSQPWRLESQGQAPGLVSSGASLFCFQITAFLLRPLRAFPPCVSSTYDDTSHVGLGHTTLKASLNLNYLFKDSLSKYNHILRYWCLGLQHMDFARRHNSTHNNVSEALSSCVPPFLSSFGQIRYIFSISFNTFY